MSARAVYRHWTIGFDRAGNAYPVYLGTFPKGHPWPILSGARSAVLNGSCFVMREDRPCDRGAGDTYPKRPLQGRPLGPDWNKCSVIHDFHRAGDVIQRHAPGHWVTHTMTVKEAMGEDASALKMTDGERLYQERLARGEIYSGEMGVW